MTHPFEQIEKPWFKRLKPDALLESMSTKRSRVCQTALNPSVYPRSAHPKGKSIWPFVVPVHSRWFNFDSVHEIERLEFPELKDPDFANEYMTIRNLAVKLFRLFPTHPLRVTTICHIHGGNFPLIKRVHRFLSLWGLINFENTLQGESDFTPDGKNFLDEYSLLFDSRLIFQQVNIQVHHLAMPCTLCKSECSDGHFLSKKYPGIVLCPKCFTNSIAFKQIGASHIAFEFRTFQQPPMPAQVIMHGEIQKRIAEHLEKGTSDWTAISNEINANSITVNNTQQQKPNTTALDCFVTALRFKEGDNTTMKTIMSHEFHNRSDLNELFEFNANSETATPAMPDAIEKRNWDEIDTEIDEIGVETKNACLHKGTNTKN